MYRERARATSYECIRSPPTVRFFIARVRRKCRTPLRPPLVSRDRYDTHLWRDAVRAWRVPYERSLRSQSRGKCAAITERSVPRGSRGQVKLRCGDEDGGGTIHPSFRHEGRTVLALSHVSRNANLVLALRCQQGHMPMIIGLGTFLCSSRMIRTYNPSSCATCVAFWMSHCRLCGTESGSLEVG